MKNNKVKGFTLIELIVVMAIFGLIMASAVSLMTPTSKIMTTAEVTEQGQAAVTNITRYIEGQISGAEYMRIYNGKYSDADRVTQVKEFARLYYEGIIKANSTAASPNYASATFHVLQIDNTQNGLISEWTYTADSLEKTALAGTNGIKQSGYKEYAVNRDYYSNYMFEFKPGIYETVQQFDSHTVTQADIIPNFKKENVSMTIKASTVRQNKQFSFVSTMGVPLVNQTFGSGNATALQGVYYCIDNLPGANPGDPAVPTIVDRGSSSVIDHEKILARYVTTDSGDNTCYTFIYAYGSEINTNP